MGGEVSINQSEEKMVNQGQVGIGNIQLDDSPVLVPFLPAALRLPPVAHIFT